MDYMAILKHTSSKNVNYTDVIQYLIFKYDESINKPLLDDFGNLQMRDQLYIDGINCDPMTFVNSSTHNIIKIKPIKKLKLINISSALIPKMLQKVILLAKKLMNLD